MEDPGRQLPFIAPVLSALRQEVGHASTVVGFVGSPWTLAAYAIEGSANKHAPWPCPSSRASASAACQN